MTNNNYLLCLVFGTVPSILHVLTLLAIKISMESEWKTTKHM